MAPQIYSTSAISFKTPAPAHKIQATERDMELDVAVVVRDLLDVYSSTEYQHIHPTNEKLEAAMRAEMKARNLRSPRLEKTVHLAASLIELAFHGCTLEEKKNIALFNWYIIYVDDAVLVNPRPFIEFQYRFTLGLPQLDPVLDAFAAVLHALSSSYPPLQANLILSAAFEFVSASCIEPQLALANSRAKGPKLPAALKVKEATRFPLFLRERTGLGVPGALMLFSPSQPIEFLDCFRALGDMSFWIAAVNDLLSFFKEQLAGETATYIHARAEAEGRSPLRVFATLKDELSAASRNITRALGADLAAVETWRMFEYGVVAWHLENDRYRLHELDQSLVCECK
ncbi:isoprenoid synthase domain-containing protein [Lyophyllum atratum]|nr:isoprenoid synthase domain-containing protein [Lyophyllum atratum]